MFCPLNMNTSKELILLLLSTLKKLLYSASLQLKPPTSKVVREVRLRQAIGRIPEMICVPSLMRAFLEAQFASGSFIRTNSSSLLQQLKILVMMCSLRIMPWSILISRLRRPLSGSTRLSAESRNCSNTSELHWRRLILNFVRFFGLIPSSVQLITSCIIFSAVAYGTFETKPLVSILPFWSLSSIKEVAS